MPYSGVKKDNNLLVAHIALVLGLLAILVALLTKNTVLLLGAVSLPFLFLGVLFVMRKPNSIFFVTFVVIYYIMGINRYVEIPAISVVVESLLGVTLVLGLIQSNYSKTEAIHTFRDRSNNILIWGMLLWFIYCIIEIINPHAMLEGWIFSRGIAYNGIVMCVLAALMIDKFRIAKVFFFLYAILSLTAALKSVMQSQFGFDFAEAKWLAGGGSSTHLLVTGTRYFSFFTDAGNFGSNMGCSMVVFTCAALMFKNKFLKVFYLFVAAISLYGLMLSGTRGAFIVPFVGFALWAVISKNFKIAISMASLVIITFCFFAFTNIGQGNQQIRRMRTAFRFSDDGSFNVRRENQKLLAEYLKDKPFGVGLGLSGVENKRIADTYTTSIPHDSWYVKLWVETGIIGFTLYALIIVGSIIQASIRIMTKVKSKEVIGLTGGLLCGITGMFVSAYGNAFWGQYPSNIIVFTGLIIALNCEYFEKETENITNDNALS